MTRLAAVDIGTNTLLLLIAEVGADGSLRAERDEVRFGRLGKGLDRSGRLAADAVERSLAILREYRQLIDAAGVEKVAAVGTQALREAANAADFLAPARDILGAAIEVVDGRREAELVYRSVAAAFPDLAAGELVVADVGGGSTEVIAGRGGVVSSLVSLPIGSVRLTERHLRGDPPTAAQVGALLADIDEHLGRLDPALAGSAVPLAPDDTAHALPSGRPKGPPALVGTAGTATTLAAVEQKLRAYDADRVQGFHLNRAAVDRQLARYLELTAAEKRGLPGLEPERADVIAAGAAIYARLVAHLGAAELITSDRGVRWGVVLELAELRRDGNQG
jgi:exopolyphosphatase / guanosine-5'-triphosphate,3'-diphosphate pyrophosphatase